MGVPPPSRPSSTPPSKGEGGPREGKKAHKEFKLPDKKKEKELTSQEAEVKELKQQMKEQQKAELHGVSEVKASEAKAAISAVSQLIQKVVAQMRIGQLDGKEFAEMKLSSSEVPQAFAGSNLTLSYQANALTIHFDNFMTPQQENNAITLIEKNKEQLLEMVQTLQSKNINVHELSIGKHVVAIPRVEPLPPPFQPTQAGAGETRQDQGRQESEPGEEDAGPE